MRSLAPRWCAVLPVLAVALAIGCDTSPTSIERFSAPRFSVVPGGGSWITEAPMTTARQLMGGGVLNGTLYAAGGALDPWDQSKTNIVEAFVPGSGWSTKAPMQVTHTIFGVAAVNGVLYAVGGGNTYSLLGTVEAYDPTTNAWTFKAPMLTGRGGAAVAAVGDVIYAAGGTDPNGVDSVVEAYDPASDAWTPRAHMRASRYVPGVGVINGIIYVVGGQSRNGSFLASVEAYDPTTDTWSARQPMPTARYGLGVAVIDGILYAVGGYNNQSGFLTTVEAYDPVTDSWTTEAPMLTAQYTPVVGAIDGVLYAAGGFSTGSVVVGTNEAFIPPFNFTGFFQPVDNPPVVNGAKAGSAIPVKFSLNGDHGLDIFATGYPVSQNQVCDGGVTDAIEQTVTANASGLTYDPVSDEYTYVWKTSKSWAGTCRTLSLELTDGSVHQALFTFKQ